MDRFYDLQIARLSLGFLGALAVCAALTFTSAVESATAYVGEEACLECHEDYADFVTRNVHGRLAKYELSGQAQGCEACHGPGELHVETNEPEDIIRFSVAEGELAATPCLSCHKAGKMFNWGVGPHAENDVGCSSCHQIHDNDAKHALLSDTQPTLCYTCHEDLKAQFYLLSHHPLREGFMVCTSCHDPHNDWWANVQEGETSRSMCLSCHVQYQGPFIFEHSPVQEDCVVCHNPHGTVANNLLRQNEPFLCLQCHQPHFHSGLEAIEGAYEPSQTIVDEYPPYGDLSGYSHPDGFKRVMLTKCSQCHSAIHGSDLPAQSITGQGRGLTR